VGVGVISIVVPAHDESSVIGRCLDAILDGGDADDLEVVVVCNGCRDDTAERARAASPRVRVLETPTASKAAALNLGDQAASGWPRVYLDADVVLHQRDLRRLAAAFDADPTLLAAAPELRVDTSRAGFAVRAYYRVWCDLPYARGDWVGSGVYALSRAARGRFGEFPPIIGDDYFVTRLFSAPGEQRRVHEARFTIFAPARARDLVRVMRRRRAAHEEYAEYAEHVGRGDPGAPGEGHGPALRALAREPRRWGDLAIYGTITLVGLASGWWKTRRGDPTAWERDESSR
jgi:glycosyltransferase involved in cell wall biosynthesis